MGSYAAVVLADKPIRYYRLGETSGTTSYDQSSNLSNGTMHGGVTFNQTGLLNADIDTSLLFDGSSSYISVPTTGFPTGAQAITLECWVYFASLPNPATFPFLLDVGTVINAQEFSLYMNNNQIQGGYRNAGNVVSNTISTQAIYHTVLTSNGTTITLYVNGIVQQSASASSPNLTLGACTIAAQVNVGLFLPGTLDEVAFYNVALSATQIKNHYLAGIGAINYPVVSLSTLTRDGSITVKARDGLSLTTKTRG